MNYTKYFRLHEFACSCGCKKNKINRTFLKVLAAARSNSLDIDRSFIPFRISSGYRCKNHILSKKNPSSSHIKGLACDIIIKNSRERAVILGSLIGAGFTRFGLGSNFIHVDLDEDKKQGIMWDYYGV
tara:strand:+ start:542 stop:925 length:384 start_codon:yes stop_codon:yes gene_type:complete